MDTEILKNAIQKDMQTLKGLDLDIMPRERYYQLNFSLYKKALAIIFSIMATSFLVSLTIHTVFFDMNDVLQIMAVMLGTILLMTGFLFVFVQGYLNSWIILHWQIKPHLETGDLLQKNIEKITRLSLFMFATLVFIPTLFIPTVVAPAGLVSFLITSLVMSMFIQMEIKRVGMAAFFKLLGRFFDKLQSGENTTTD